MLERERSIDINSLSQEQIDELSIQIGDKVRSIVDEAVEKTNKFLKIYGMSAKMHIVLDHESLIKLNTEPKKKRGRPRKTTNL